MDTCTVAVAADVSKPLDELGPDDWEMMEVRACMHASIWTAGVVQHVAERVHAHMHM